MRVTFLGTGTSQGVPVIGCGCAVCGSNDPKDHRLRSSLYVEVGSLRLVIDTGPDFRQQVLREGIEHIDAVLFTHEHQDHIAGLDDIRPFNREHNEVMPLYARPSVLRRIRVEFSYVFCNPYGGAPRVSLHAIRNRPFAIGDTLIQPIEAWHHRLAVYGFRIEDFVYLTDVKTISPAEQEKMKNCKIIVINAIKKTPHIAHLNLAEARQLVERLQPDSAYFTHISHYMGKHEEVNNELPRHMRLAHDGLRLAC